MALHGQYVSDSSKQIRFVRGGDDSYLRVLLHENWYDRLKPLYDWFEEGATLVTDVPEQVEKCFDWLLEISIEIEVYGWVFAMSITWLLAKLAKQQVSLGKFTYKKGGQFGSSRLGAMPLGGGTQLLELPVEG